VESVRRVPSRPNYDGRGDAFGLPPRPEHHGTAEPPPQSYESPNETEEGWTRVAGKSGARRAPQAPRAPDMTRIHGGFWARAPNPPETKTTRRRKKKKTSKRLRSASSRRYQALRRPETRGAHTDAEAPHVEKCARPCHASNLRPTRRRTPKADYCVQHDVSRIAESPYGGGERLIRGHRLPNRSSSSVKH